MRWKSEAAKRVFKLAFSPQKAQRALFRPVLNEQSYDPTFRRLLLLLLLKLLVNCVWDRECLKDRAIQEALVSIPSPIQNRMFLDIVLVLIPNPIQNRMFSGCSIYSSPILQNRMFLDVAFTHPQSYTKQNASGCSVYSLALLSASISF